MVNIGNNIFDNLKQMRRLYVAPAVFMEDMEEKGEMLAGSPVDVTSGDMGKNEEGWDGDAKSNNLIFFGDEAEEWLEDEE